MIPSAAIERWGSLCQAFGVPNAKRAVVKGAKAVFANAKQKLLVIMKILCAFEAGKACNSLDGDSIRFFCRCFLFCKARISQAQPQATDTFRLKEVFSSIQRNICLPAVSGEETQSPKKRKKSGKESVFVTYCTFWLGIWSWDWLLA